MLLSCLRQWAGQEMKRAVGSKSQELTALYEYTNVKLFTIKHFDIIALNSTTPLRSDTHYFQWLAPRHDGISLRRAKR